MIELTESAIMEDQPGSLKTLYALKSIGLKLAMDDFGTGFSSLAYLSDFPFSKVKIDKKFSQDMGKSLKVRQIVKGIAQITRELGIDLVAEGVETMSQLAFLRASGCNQAQGRLFGEAEKVESLLQHLQSQQSGRPAFGDLIAGTVARTASA